MVKQFCWNNISENLGFILSNVSEVDGKNFMVQRKNRSNLNKHKGAKSDDEVLICVKEIYHLIHDINVFVYKSEKFKTIIEIRYYLKSELEPEYLHTVLSNRSMLHCKIAKPPYIENDKDKFDVNWELGGIMHYWKMFWWLRKMKRRFN